MLLHVLLCSYTMLVVNVLFACGNTLRERYEMVNAHLDGARAALECSDGAHARFQSVLQMFERVHTRTETSGIVCMLCSFQTFSIALFALHISEQALSTLYRLCLHMLSNALTTLRSFIVHDNPLRNALRCSCDTLMNSWQAHHFFRCVLPPC